MKMEKREPKIKGERVAERTSEQPSQTQATPRKHRSKGHTDIREQSYWEMMGEKPNWREWMLIPFILQSNGPNFLYTQVFSFN